MQRGSSVELSETAVCSVLFSKERFPRTNCLDSSYYQIDTLIDPFGPAKLYRCNVLVQYKQTKIWFFIVYLGLLINLGPSLHHADFLGLHVHSSSVSSCGCCHSHSGSHSHHHSDSSGELAANSSAEHDCALCKFFDQYHVIVDVVDFQECSAFAAVSYTHLTLPTIYSV